MGSSSSWPPPKKNSRHGDDKHFDLMCKHMLNSVLDTQFPLRPRSSPPPKKNSRHGDDKRFDFMNERTLKSLFDTQFPLRPSSSPPPKKNSRHGGDTLFICEYDEGEDASLINGQTSVPSCPLRSRSWPSMKPRKQQLKLVTGSHYIPLPKKNSPNGDDAHFISKSKQIVGVADGVGGWAERGIDAGEFARQLMRMADVLHQFMDYNSLEPKELLWAAFNRIRAPGSSTACIVALKDQSLHAANVGDSGFVLVRNGKAVYQSGKQCRSFNIPYQLGRGSDTPDCAKEMMVPVMAGDTVVVGTDGLFDNMFDHQIASTVNSGRIRDISADSLAFAIAMKAKLHSEMKYRETPFSKQWSEFYRRRRQGGGKRDDITVVVMYIVAADA